MGGRSQTTFKKRQKEMSRAEKQREKTAKRMERKQEQGNGGSGPEVISLEEATALRNS